jgi:hypothetical protein
MNERYEKMAGTRLSRERLAVLDRAAAAAGISRSKMVGTLIAEGLCDNTRPSIEEVIIQRRLLRLQVEARAAWAEFTEAIRAQLKIKGPDGLSELEERAIAYRSELNELISSITPPQQAAAKN